MKGPCPFSLLLGEAGSLGPCSAHRHDGVGPVFPLVFDWIRTGIIKNVFFVPLGHAFPVFWVKNRLFFRLFCPAYWWFLVAGFSSTSSRMHGKQKENPGNLPPCHSSSPKVPSLQYIFFTSFRVFLYLLITSGMF